MNPLMVIGPPVGAAAVLTFVAALQGDVSMLAPLWLFGYYLVGR